MKSDVTISIMHLTRASLQRTSLAINFIRRLCDDLPLVLAVYLEIESSSWAIKILYR